MGLDRQDRDADEHDHREAAHGHQGAGGVAALGPAKAGTPLLIASTPVSAVHPDAKARSARNSVNAPPTLAVRGSASWALAAVRHPMTEDSRDRGGQQQQATPAMKP